MELHSPVCKYIGNFTLQVGCCNCTPCSGLHGLKIVLFEQCSNVWIMLTELYSWILYLFYWVTFLFLFFYFYMRMLKITIRKKLQHRWDTNIIAMLSSDIKKGQYNNNTNVVILAVRPSCFMSIWGFYMRFSKKIFWNGGKMTLKLNGLLLWPSGSG